LVPEIYRGNLYGQSASHFAHFSFLNIMSQEIISLTKKLIRLKTIPDHPDQLKEALQIITSELSDFSIEWFETDGVQSILVHNQPTRPEKYKLILNTHLDIIPGNDSQYEPREDGDKLYGVGAMDMKGNLVAALHAFKRVAHRVSYPLAMQFVTDEEIGGFLGTKYQIEQGVLADFVISTEPTNFDIVHEAKGVLWLEITASGKTAHGAYPWRGDNAIEKIAKFLDRLQTELPNPPEQVWQTTHNIATITSPNTAFNKIPDSCTVGLDIRFIPTDADIVLKRIEQLLPADFTLKVVANEPALDTDKNHPYLTLLGEITEKELARSVTYRGAQGSSDARHFARVGCPGIEFGPIGEGIGSDDEWVSIEGLEQFSRILEEFMLKLDTLK
jgi:succinyl-diaminopimelate desuccinylase